MATVATKPAKAKPSMMLPLMSLSSSSSVKSPKSTSSHLKADTPLGRFKQHLRALKANSRAGRRSTVSNGGASTASVDDGSDASFYTEYQSARSRAEGQDYYQSRLTKTTFDVSRRNRYGNVVTLEDTRVRLESALARGGAGGSDYINASFVDGGRFVAAQAPLCETAEHFWGMIWERNIDRVFMLTPFDELLPTGETRDKADPYFPFAPDAPEERYGGFRVKCVSMEVLAADSEDREELVVRKLLLSPIGASEEEDAPPPRVVSHYHYTGWPDFGVVSPERMRVLVSLIRAAGGGSAEAPPVVHCSAGIGRSGAFLAAAMALQRFGQGEDVDVESLVAQLRNERPGMVQTLAQYEMIYDVLAACFSELPPPSAEGKTSSATEDESAASATVES